MRLEFSSHASAARDEFAHNGVLDTNVARPERRNGFHAEHAQPNGLLVDGHDAAERFPVFARGRKHNFP